MQLGASNSGLSFHLKELAHSGLVSCEPPGRTATLFNPPAMLIAAFRG
jgi:predicted ArsR family transcriptional regulator